MPLKIGAVGSEVLMPTPKSAVYGYNKLWSENTGRLDSGHFVGELVATKRTVDFTFPPLSPTQLAKLQSAVNTDFARVVVDDMSVAGTSSTNFYFDAYFGDLTFSAYSWKGDIKYAIDVKFTAIEV